jgi:glycosyltransferase involved in cell wall biosynthesis
VKIGFDGKFLWEGSYGGKSGHSIHAMETLLEFMRLDKANQFNVYLPEQVSQIPKQKNFHEVVLPLKSKNSFVRNLASYPMELSRNPIDVLMSWSTVPCFIHCKTVLLLADIFWIVYPEFLPSKLRWPRIVSLKYSVKRADKIITTTEFSKQEIIHHLNVPDEKIKVIGHGVRAHFKDAISPEKIEETKAKYGIQGEYILSINDIHPRKNLDGLVDAFFLLKDHYQIPHKLVLVGRALWSYPELFDKVEKSKYKSDVIFPGYVAAEDISTFYHGATMFVYCSFYEGWGLQVHEAMSASVPVVVSRGSSMAEIGGEAALDFDPFDITEMSETIYRVLDSSPLREEMIQKGLDQIKKYSWETVSQQTLDICRKVYEQ